MSYPSTDTSPLEGPSERVGFIHDLMYPPDGSYPQIEWEDCPVGIREQYATTLVTRSLRALSREKKIDVDPIVFQTRMDQIREFTCIEKFTEYEQIESFREMVGNYVNEILMESELSFSLPVAASPTHLMAVGPMLQRARRMVKEGSAYRRKVAFTEPVRAWTCLSGDQIAHAGDMLTAVTVSDTKRMASDTKMTKDLYVAEAVTT